MRIALSTVVEMVSSCAASERVKICKTKSVYIVTDLHNRLCEVCRLGRLG